jgi:hypothetical protein
MHGTYNIKYVLCFEKIYSFYIRSTVIDSRQPYIT